MMLLSGRVQHGVKPGPKLYLNQSKEQDLANKIFGSYLKYWIWEDKEAYHEPR